MNYSTWLRVKVILRAWPTRVVVALVVATELAPVIGVDHPVVTAATTVAVTLGATVAIIRKVTPVLPGAEGVLPSGGPHTSTERYLANELAYTRRVLKEGG